MISDGTVGWWGDISSGPSTPPFDLFHHRRVSAGGQHTCAVKVDGTVGCWGWDYYGQSTPPSGTFREISAEGSYHVCAVKADGTVGCWGNNIYGQSTPPSGTFRQVGAASFHTCGLKADGTAACWGDDFYGQSTPPSGTFRQVGVGPLHNCGVKSDGTVACWGNDTYGESTPLTGTFKLVDAGWAHTCGVKTDGTVACWGNDTYGQSTPLTGTFKLVNTNECHDCGVRTDGTLACWGDDTYGQSTPPSGTFRHVSPGSKHTCGVRTTGGIVCWGRNLFGEAYVVAVNPSALPRGEVQLAYSQTVTATGGAAPYTYTVPEGGLPPGLTLSAIGTLTGTPTASGNFVFTVQAMDGNAVVGQKTYTLGVSGHVYLPLVLRAYTTFHEIDEAPDDCEQALAVEIGHQYREDFDHIYDKDWYTFSATAGVTYTIQVADLESDADTVLYLYQAGCGDPDPIWNDDCVPGDPTSGSCVTWQAPANGAYPIMARNYYWHLYYGPGFDTGYTLSVKEGTW